MTQCPPITVLLASPRGCCAGVDRAIQIVERAITKYGAPVYVRHEIVHNRHVVDRLKALGAVFVEELDDCPTDRPVVFSAHGVPKSVPAEAKGRKMLYLDATCPLVSKVHVEAERHHDAGREIVLIGHAGHPEVVGTMGQLPDGAVVLIETLDDVAAYQPQDPAKAPITTEAKGENLRAPGSVETGTSNADDGSSRNEKTVNFEVDRAIERIKSSKGQLRRVSAAVVLDYKYEKGAKANATRSTPYTPQEIQQINGLVKDAIGFVQRRGDTVSVANLPFSAEPTPVPEETSQFSPDLISQIVRYLAITLGLLFAYFAIARPLLRPVPLPPLDPDLPNSPQGRAAQRMREEIKEMDLSWSMGQEVKRAQEMRVEREIEAQVERMREREVASKAKFEDMVSYATQYASDQPDDTALLLRAWVAETGGAATNA